MNSKLLIAVATAILLGCGCSKKKTEEQRAQEVLSNALVTTATSTSAAPNDDKWPDPPKDAPTGRLGLTAEELAKIWGAPQGDAEPQPPADSAKRYAHGGYGIVTHFWNGKAGMLDVKRSGASLTDAEVLSLLETLTGKAGWPATGYRRVRNDGACVLQIMGFNSNARIYTREFWEAQQKAKAEEERQRGKGL